MRRPAKCVPSLVRTFLRQERAVTAVETALLAPGFLLVVYAWVEVGFCLLMLSTLDNAARDASRLIRVGATTEANFKAAVCARASPFVPCAGIVYNVRSGASFAALTPATASKGALSSTGYVPGGSGAEVLIQLGYSKPAFFSPLLASAGFGGNILLLSTLAFSSEAY